MTAVINWRSYAESWKCASWHSWPSTGDSLVGIFFFYQVQHTQQKL